MGWVRAGPSPEKVGKCKVGEGDLGGEDKDALGSRMTRRAAPWLFALSGSRRGEDHHCGGRSGHDRWFISLLFFFLNRLDSKLRKQKGQD